MTLPGALRLVYGRAPRPLGHLWRRPRLSRRLLTVESAVRRDLASIAARDKALAEGGLAASALALAREIDSATNSATSKSMCARALVETLNKLRELAPAKLEDDAIDDLRRDVLRVVRPA